MEIYLDYIFFENFIINYIILIQVPMFCKFKNKKINIIISDLILSCYTTIIQVVYTSFLEINILKILIIFSCIYIAFKPKRIILYLKYFLYYLMFNFLYIGINIFIILFFDISIEKIIIKIIIYLLSGLILILINKFLWKMWKNNIKNQIIYQIIINKLEIDVFVDTGNNVRDNCNNIDVIFLSDEYKDEILKIKNLGKIKLNISTALSKGNIEGYIFENVKIKNRKININLKKAEIVFIDKKIFEQKMYKGLISYDTYIEKLKGATL